MTKRPISEHVALSLSETRDRPRLSMVVTADDCIVYAGGSGKRDTAEGQTPGEFFGCIHAHEETGGCGTTAACRFCGVREALEACRGSEGHATTTECTIRTHDDGGVGARNYRVFASPFILENEPYVFVDLEDIADEKRREALERVFYHDILNTATGLRVYLDLLKHEVDTEDSGKVISTLYEISDSLVEEINSQRMLTSAERGTLQMQYDLVNCRDLLTRAASILSGDAEPRGIRVTISEESEEATIITDGAILRRVVVNAGKNAVEASESGDTVALACRKHASGVEITVHNRAYIPSEVRLQMFNRFYSTKGANRGLGTYSMLLFTENYLAGSISLVTDRERGTTITLRLPDDPRTARDQ